MAENAAPAAGLARDLAARGSVRTPPAQHRGRWPVAAAGVLVLLLGGGAAWWLTRPAAVVTDLGLFDFAEDGEMRLTAVYPGVRVDDVQAKTGWPLRVAEHLDEIPPLSDRERALLAALTRGEEAAAG
jgi:hypothetical protein